MWNADALNPERDGGQVLRLNSIAHGSSYHCLLSRVDGMQVFRLRFIAWDLSIS